MTKQWQKISIASSTYTAIPDDFILDKEYRGRIWFFTQLKPDFRLETLRE